MAHKALGGAAVYVVDSLAKISGLRVRGSPHGLTLTEALQMGIGQVTGGSVTRALVSSAEL